MNTKSEEHIAEVGEKVENKTEKEAVTGIRPWEYFVNSLKAGREFDRRRLSTIHSTKPKSKNFSTTTHPATKKSKKFFNKNVSRGTYRLTN